MSARAAVLAQFTVDEHGRIRNPGKFEGEPLFVPHFWDVFMDGCHDDEAEDGAVIFFVTDEDRAEFPELGTQAKVTLFQRDDGFVVEV